MMLLIKIIAVVALSPVVFANQNIKQPEPPKLAQDSEHFKKCIDQLGGSASLVPSCYIDEAEKYKKESDLFYKKLFVQIPKKYHKDLSIYRHSIFQQLKICELKYQAYYGWGEDPIDNATVGDSWSAECKYKIRKQEFTDLKEMECYPSGAC